MKNIFATILTVQCLVLLSFMTDVIFGSFDFPPTELKALEELFVATRGYEWTWQQPYEKFGNEWNFNQSNPNPCTENWQGIECSSQCVSSPCYLTKLQLVGLGLGGRLPSTLDQLTKATQLEIASNYGLIGTIPSTLGNMTLLQQLQLWYNSLTGKIPKELSNLRNLQELQLHNNRLSSTIPSTLFNDMPNLQTFQVDYNLNLDGTIPTTIGTTSLTRLELGGNQFSGTLPESLYSLVNMTIFSVSTNKFNGTISNSIGQWENVISIDFAFNLLTGTLPMGICNMTKLEKVYFSGNYLYGTLPSCLNEMTNLKELYLPNNKFTGTIPNTWTNITNLKILDLQTNLLSGALPETLGQLENCSAIILQDNRLSGTIPSSIGNMKVLRVLELGDNRFSGTIPKEITKCWNLTTLVISTNKLKGSIPDRIGDLHRLETLQLQNNFLSGTLPITITNAQSLSSLLLFNNTLRGTLPDTWDNCESLKDVQLNYNYFSGTIPPTLFTLSRLQTLQLSENAFIGTLPIVELPVLTLSPLKILAVANNSLSGTIPSAIGQYNLLATLSLELNDFTGTLPSELGNLRSLVECTIANTLVTGEIPSSIVGLTRLTKLTLSNNRLNGTLPSNMSALVELTAFSAFNNDLTGTIPTSIVDCHQLSFLDLSNNKLTGTIPDQFGYIQKLHEVVLKENSLSGPIPSALFTNILLTQLSLQSNLLSGEFPSNISKSLNLKLLAISDNMISGTLPNEIGKMISLTYLYIMRNEFSGSLPDSLYTMNHLEIFYGFNNQFSGTISSKIGHLRNLNQLYVYDNYFRGELPEPLFRLPYASEIYINNNYFSGNLPWDGIHIPVFYLVELYMDNNMLTGTIPDAINHFADLVTLNMSSNYFNGTFPVTFCKLLRVHSVDVSFNELTGSLSGVFSCIYKLRLLFLNNNKFHGSIQDVFNTSIQTALRYVDLSSNQLSGSLSDEFFASQNLSSFAAVKNCLTGSIPSTICNNRLLFSLALDGLHTADQCKQKVLPGLSTYRLDDVITGTIPRCLFEMPVLNTLHLSGNGIKGSIPQDIVVSRSISDLSLSHNDLTGTIPLSIQDHIWESLDLSFNKLRGSLSSNMSSVQANSQNQSQWSLDMDVNRLSGRMPSSLLAVSDIDILAGNLFTCKFSRAKRHEYLPKHDESYASYQCGSNSVDGPLYIFTIIAGLLVIVSVALYYKIARSTKTDPMKRVNDRVSDVINRFRKWWSIFRGLEAINSFGNDMAALRSLCSKWTVLVVFVLLPLYAVFHVYFSTHQYTYGWIISIAYIGGFTPAIISLVVLICVFVLVEINLQWIGTYFFTQSSVLATDSSNATKGIKQRKSLQNSRLVDLTTDVVAKLSLSRIELDLQREYGGMQERESHATRSLDNIETDEPRNNSNDTQSIPLLTSTFSALLIRKVQGIMIITTIIVANFFIVLAVNGVYVYSTIKVFDPWITRLITFLTVVFKIVWSLIVVAGYFANIFQKVLNVFVESALKEMVLSKENNRLIYHGVDKDTIKSFEQRIRFYEKHVSLSLIWMSLFNSVVAPCMAVLMVSPECYYYLVVEPDPVSVSYRFFKCSGIFYSPSDGYVCLGKEFATHSTSYTPAFNYSYQCTSAVLASFANIYLLRYLITGLVIPILLFVVKYAHEWIYRNKVYPLLLELQQNKGNDNGESSINMVKENIWYQVFQSMNYVLPGTLNFVDFRVHRFKGLIDVTQTVVVSNPINEKPMDTGEKNCVKDIPSVSQEPAQKPKEYFGASILSAFRLLPSFTALSSFNARRFSNVVVGDLAIFLTFGSIYPPLAVVVFVGIVSNSVAFQLMLGRFMTIIRDYIPLVHYKEVIERETAAVGSLISLSLPPITTLAAVFWSFFFFDILGDEMGLHHSLWIFGVLPCLWIVMRVIALITGEKVRLREFVTRIKGRFNSFSLDATIVMESEMANVQTREAICE